MVENGSYEKLTHRRSVFFVDKKYFVIMDDAFGEVTGEVDIHFQLAPGKAVIDHAGLTVRSDFENGWNVLVKTEKQPGIILEEEEGQVSFLYTKKEPRPAFRFRVKKENSMDKVRFITLVIPYEKGIPEITIKVIDEQGLRMEIKAPTLRYVNIPM